MNALLDRLGNYRSVNRLLDVGCGLAFFLGAARNRNWQVQGVEVSAFGTTYSREQLGIDVFRGTLQDARFPAETYDVVTSSHVIEHVADPLSLVREMARVVRHGGAVVATVPTQLSSPGYKLFGLTSGEAPPRHVSFFSPTTLSRLMKSVGLRPVFQGVNIEYYQALRAVKTILQLSGWAATRPGDQVFVESLSAQSVQPEPISRRWVQMMKQVVNTFGVRFGVSDEVTIIAVKD